MSPRIRNRNGLPQYCMSGKERLLYTETVPQNVSGVLLITVFKVGKYTPLSTA